MKVLYLATTGAGDPTKASIPLHIAANGSVEADQECAVVLAGDATELVSQETAERVRALGFLLRAIFSRSSSLDNRVPVYV
jgi:predicted peroxiredoxin